MTSSPAKADEQPTALSDLPPQDCLRILTAATEAFTSHGYAGTTVAHLQAQIDAAAFDALFDDTEDCFLQIYDYLIHRSAAIISDAVFPEGTWPERLAAALSAVFELVEANPSSARLVLVETRVATPTVFAHYMSTINSIASFMREGRALSESPIPPIVDTALPAGIAHVLGGRLCERPSEPIDDLYPELLRVLLLPFLGDAETTAFLSPRTARSSR